MSQLDARTLGAAVHAHFDTHTLAKGRVYQHQRRVQNCLVTLAEPRGWIIAADVRGSQPTPYGVEIQLSSGDGTPVIQGSCSCPMAGDCKHVAAVLLHVLEKPEQWFNPSTALTSDAAPSLLTTPLTSPGLDGQWDAWLRRLDQAARTASGSGDALALRGTPPDSPDEIHYILHRQSGRLKLELAVVRLLKAGGYSQPRTFALGNVLYNDPPAPFVRPVDVLLVRKAMLAQPTFNAFELFLEGVVGAGLLKEILATGRCHWRGSGKQHPVLALGPARSAQPAWIADAQGRQRPGFHVTPPATGLLPLAPPWYWDETSSTCGPLETGLADAVAGAWLAAPLVAPHQAAAVSAELIKHADTLGLPAPLKVDVEDVSDVRPVPRLRLYSAQLKRRFYSYGWATDSPEEEEVNFAHLDFDYAGSRVAPQEGGDLLEHFANGRLRRVRRHSRLENKAERTLSNAGLQYARHVLFDCDFRKFANELTFAEPEEWFDFVHSVLPGLRDQGWRIDTDDSFRFRLAEPEDWYGDAEADGGNNWFGVELGVLLDGQKVNLLPILIELLQASPHTLNGETLANLPEDAIIPVPLPDGRTLPFPARRARQMLGVLLELLDPNTLDRHGRLRLNKLRAAELAGEADWRWLGNAELSELSRRLRSFDGIKPVAPPPTLHATLRPYQQEGLNWHFTADGTLIEAWASMKSFVRKDGTDEKKIQSAKDDDPGNPTVNFRGEKRSNVTHQSTSDPESVLYRKAAGKESKLCFGAQVLMENRNGLCAAITVHNPIAEDEPTVALAQVDEHRELHEAKVTTVGGDKAYHEKKFVAGCREREIAPHVACKEQIAVEGLDGRTTRSSGYEVSQRLRKRVEEIFGWMKTVGGLRRSRYRGAERTQAWAYLVASSYNLLRMAKLGLAAPT